MLGSSFELVLSLVYWPLMANFEVVLYQWMLKVYGGHPPLILLVSFFEDFGRAMIECMSSLWTALECYSGDMSGRLQCCGNYRLSTRSEECR